MNNDWLNNEFPKFQGRMLKGEVLAAYYEAERILKNKETLQRRGCSCEYGTMAREVDRLYEIYRQNQTK